jgi:hypothetical protein
MEGVLIGSDSGLEWALPWWWKRYKLHNSHPVAFIDMGLTQPMKTWCKRRGSLLPLKVVDFTDEVPAERASEWEEKTGTSFWGTRSSWFKKPLACLKSPFETTLWMDIDCEIRGSIAPLFDLARRPTGLAMAKEQLDFSKPYPCYNSGLIAFRQNHPLIQEWADSCFKLNSQFRADDDVFAYLLARKGMEIDEIPPIYNWSRCRNENPDAIVLHWHGSHGKTVIRNQIWSESTR